MYNIIHQPNAGSSIESYLLYMHELLSMQVYPICALESEQLACHFNFETWKSYITPCASDTRSVMTVMNSQAIHRSIIVCLFKLRYVHFARSLPRLFTGYHDGFVVNVCTCVRFRQVINSPIREVIWDSGCTGTGQSTSKFIAHHDVECAPAETNVQSNCNVIYFRSIRQIRE